MESGEYDKLYRIEREHAWFNAKRSMVVDWIGEHRPPARILDVGCGTGANLEALSRLGWAVGCDSSLKALEFCRGLDAPLVCASAEALPFREESFGLITAFMWLWSGHDIALHHRRRYTRSRLTRLFEPRLRILRQSYWCALISPFIAARIARDNLLRRKHFSYVQPLTPTLNRIVGMLFGLERRLMKLGGLPFGVSMIAVARKK